MALIGLLVSQMSHFVDNAAAADCKCHFRNGKQTNHFTLCFYYDAIFNAILFEEQLILLFDNYIVHKSLHIFQIFHHSHRMLFQRDNRVREN